jgi:rod shape-determining protein MreD
MRRHVFAGLALLLAALIESALLPTALGSLPRPNLVLIIACAWSALRGYEAYAWALGGGLALDLLSSAPFGAHTAGIVLGNVIAMLLDRFPMPAEFFRATNWVAIATLVYHVVQLTLLNAVGRGIGLPLALFGTILPLLLINPVLSLLAYAALAPLQARLNEQERFAK